MQERFEKIPQGLGVGIETIVWGPTCNFGQPMDKFTAVFQAEIPSMEQCVPCAYKIHKENPQSKGISKVSKPWQTVWNK